MQHLNLCKDNDWQLILKEDDQYKRLWHAQEFPPNPEADPVGISMDMAPPLYAGSTKLFGQVTDNLQRFIDLLTLKAPGESKESPGSRIKDELDRRNEKFRKTGESLIIDLTSIWLKRHKATIENIAKDDTFSPEIIELLQGAENAINDAVREIGKAKDSGKELG